jgi:hypothetical protein
LPGYHSDKIGRVFFARGPRPKMVKFRKEKSHAANGKFVSLAFTNDL